MHPYIRRRQGEPWQHDHPLLARALDKTLGVPLFQEQVMQIAVDAAGFTPGEADELRCTMGSKRALSKMDRLRDRFYRRAAANGIHGDFANKIFLQVQSFSGYGVPQSHALAFAHLVFVSAWLKRHHPAAFCAALLRTQPMAFYTPQSLVADARRHGVNIRRAQVGTSLAHAGLEPDPTSTGGHAIRLGLAGIRTLGDDLATRIADHRRRYGPLRKPRRPGPPHQPHHTPTRSTGHRGRARRTRSRPPRRAVESRRCRPRTSRHPARHCRHYRQRARLPRVFRVSYLHLTTAAPRP